MLANYAEARMYAALFWAWRARYAPDDGAIAYERNLYLAEAIGWASR